MVDLCLPKGELEAVKEMLLQTIDNLPQNIYVGLLAFNRNVLLCDFEDEFPRFTCLRGSEGNALCMQTTRIRSTTSLGRRSTFRERSTPSFTVELCRLATTCPFKPTLRS